MWNNAARMTPHLLKTFLKEWCPEALPLAGLGGAQRLLAIKRSMLGKTFESMEKCGALASSATGSEGFSHGVCFGPNRPLRRQMLKNLRSRLLLLIACALAPSLLFQIYNERADREIRRHLMQDEALRIVGLVDTQLLRIIDGADEVLDVIANAPDVQDGVPGQ